MITQEELKKILHYDPETGVFTRLKSGHGVCAGAVAGYVSRTSNGKSYIKISVKNKQYHAHRLAWMYVTGKFPLDEIDHINGQGTDNRFINMRAISSAENGKNMRRSSTNTSGVCGVSWFERDKCWRAQIRINRRTKHLGYFDTIIHAADARKNAEAKYGFHQNHGSDRPL